LSITYESYESDVNYAYREIIIYKSLNHVEKCQRIMD